MSSSQSKTKDKHVIWSDINLDLDDWREKLQADYRYLLRQSDKGRYYKSYPQARR